MACMSVVIKGAGETASGIAFRLFTAGITRICMIDIRPPLCVRRQVSFCEAIFEHHVEVEGIRGVLVNNRAALEEAWARKEIGVMADPQWTIIQDLKPDVVVDAILAKRNLGTSVKEARIVIGVGPGFSAPDTVHAVIESNRGANLGRVIYQGTAEPHTGIPSDRGGFTRERVLRAPHAGMVRHVRTIGDAVKAGETVLYVDSTVVRAEIDGILRGLIREIHVEGKEKLGDIEPAGGLPDCQTLSDKALAIGGGVLEAIRRLQSQGNNE